jgi:Family of unknown function (DUF6221)
VDDRIVFLSERILEDANGACEVHTPRACGSVDRDGEFDPDPVYCGCDYPKRVLREVAAKSAIVQRWKEQDTMRYDNAEDESRAWLLDAVLRDLLAIYSDHPDYRAGWKP